MKPAMKPVPSAPRRESFVLAADTRNPGADDLRRVLGASRKASGLQRIEKELLWLTAFSVVALPSANSYVVAATSDQFVGRKLSLVSSFPDVGQNSLLASPIAVDTPL